MSVSGPEALRSLDEALRDIRREEDEIAKRLSRSAELVTKIRETEGELFRQLAQVRLDPATQAELSGRLSQAELKARDQLKKHATEVGATEQKLADLDRRIGELNAERAKLNAEVEARQSELTAIATRIMGTAGKDPAYEKARKTADELLQIAGESMRKTQQAEADREQKGKPYRDDTLFMYLWERGYGTSTYKARNLTAWLDGMVARLVDYHKARPNFAMLNEIPLRLREHAERQGELAEGAAGEVAELEKAAIDAAGGRPVREALEAASKRITEIDAAMVAAEDERDDIAEMQNKLAEGSDPAFASAIAALGEALGREDIKVLLEEARKTETGQDDTIVKQIDDARQRVLEEENETRDQKQRLKTLASRRRELEDIQYEFKKSRYDDPSSTFRDGNLVGDLLTDFLRGGISAGSYWDQWRRSQSWTGGPPSQWGTPSPWGRMRHDNARPPLDERELAQREREQEAGFEWPDFSFGGSPSGRRNDNSGFGGSWGRLPGLGSSSRSSSGPSFSRPRSGSSGTRGHGGFKTGGGF